MRRLPLIIFILGLLLWGSTLFSPAPQQVSTQQTEAPMSHNIEYPRNAEVDQIFAELGITDISKVEAKVSDQTECAPMPSLRACAVSTDHLQVTFTSEWVNADILRKRATVGHEYLHWLWQNNIRPSDADLNAVYPLLVVRMKDYERLGVGTPAFLNEVNSIACTEVADYKLPLTLRQYCASHIPSRNLLPSYY